MSEITQSVQQLAAAAKLAQICAQYPALQIQPNSLHRPGGKYGEKLVVRVKCPYCPAILNRATSDLHTLIGCEGCKAEVRKANKALKKAGLAPLAKPAGQLPTPAPAPAPTPTPAPQIQEGLTDGQQELLTKLFG